MDTILDLQNLTPPDPQRGCLVVRFDLDASVDDALIRLMLASSAARLEIDRLEGDGDEVYPWNSCVRTRGRRWLAVLSASGDGPIVPECVESFLDGAAVHLPEAEVRVVASGSYLPNEWSP